MKIIQKTVRKQRNSEMYRLNLKYEKSGKIKVFSLIEPANKIKNVMAFRLAALTKNESVVDIGEMLENRRKVSVS